MGMILNKKILLVLITLIFCILVLPEINARDIKHFSIEKYDINYILNPKGSVDVNQELIYYLDGCFKELYIKKPQDIKIINANGYCDSNCEFKIDSKDVSESGKRELILSGDFCDKKVKANFNYKISKVI